MTCHASMCVGALPISIMLGSPAATAARPAAPLTLASFTTGECKLLGVGLLLWLAPGDAREAQSSVCPAPGVVPTLFVAVGLSRRTASLWFWSRGSSGRTTRWRAIGYDLSWQPGLTHILLPLWVAFRLSHANRPTVQRERGIMVEREPSCEICGSSDTDAVIRCVNGAR